MRPPQRLLPLTSCTARDAPRCHTWSAGSASVTTVPPRVRTGCRYGRGPCRASSAGSTTYRATSVAPTDSRAGSGPVLTAAPLRRATGTGRRPATACRAATVYPARIGTATGVTRTASSAASAATPVSAAQRVGASRQARPADRAAARHRPPPLPPDLDDDQPGVPGQAGRDQRRSPAAPAAPPGTRPVASAARSTASSADHGEREQADRHAGQHRAAEPAHGGPRRRPTAGTRPVVHRGAGGAGRRGGGEQGHAPRGSAGCRAAPGRRRRGRRPASPAARRCRRFSP